MGRQKTHRLHTVHTHDIAHRPLFDTAVMVELKNAVPQIYQFLHIFRRQHFNAEDRIDIFIQAERQNARSPPPAPSRSQRASDSY